MNSNSKNYIAIDIAKNSLAVHCDFFNGSFDYNAQGLQQLLVKLKTINTPIVVCEATGGYERKLMNSLQEHAIAVALLNPSRVRAFARSEGVKAKRDPIDAALLLRFAQSKDPQPASMHSTEQQRLQALMDRRSQLTEAIASEKNRLEKCPECVRPSIEKIMAIPEEELARIDAAIQQLIDEDKAMSAFSLKMQSVTGVGKVTAWSILAYLSEISTLGRNQLVALAGIAPFNKDSGKYKGKRRIEGGRAKVRKCLYMAAQSAAIHNEHIKKYVEGLRARGKPYKCAIVAAMRKLLIHLQILLKKQQTSIA